MCMSPKWRQRILAGISFLLSSCGVLSTKLSLLIFLRKDFSLNQELANSAGQAGQEGTLQPLLSPRAVSGFYTRVGDPNSGPHAP